MLKNFDTLKTLHTFVSKLKTKNMINIEVLRESFRWGSNGKFHDEELTVRFLKDISDSHLSHIIPWVEDGLKMGNYSQRILDILKAEQKYRKDNYIFVSEYDANQNKITIIEIKI